MAHSSPSTLGGEHSGAGPFKRKLDALGYTNTDGTADTPLMRQVVDDLIHTTDCYLALKQQASSGIQHLNHLTDKVAVLTKDSERLAAENNHLHLRIIQETEKHKAQEREHLTRLRKLEDTVAELNFYKSSSAERHAALEKENAGLRAKTQELLHDLDAYQQIEGEQRSYRPLHLDMAEPLLQRAAVMPQQQPNALAENVDILRATEHRVVSLEALLKEKEAQLNSARQNVEQLQEAVVAREAEIVRLGQEASRSRDVDALALQHRCEGQESLILQLTEQVDMLKIAVSEAEAEVARREDVTAQLAQSDRARMELELKLKNALRDNAGASREVKTMRASLKTLQLSRLRHTSPHSAKHQSMDISESATRALELAEQRLAEAAAELQRRSVVLQEVSAEKDAALAKVAALEGQIQCTRPETSGRQQSTGKTGAASVGVGEGSAEQTDPQQLSDQIRFLSDERAVLAEDLARATARAEHLELQQSQALADHAALRAELEEAQKQAHSMAGAVQTLTADKTNKSERLKAAEAEADALRQALTRQAAGGNPADEERCRQAEQLLAQQLGVCNRVTEELAQAKQHAGSAAQHASAMEAVCSRLQQELQSCREAQEAAAGRAHALQHELQQARAVSEERSRDVAQLREVSVQADQALQQCMAQLQALRADAEAKAGMLKRAAEAQQCLQAEVERLKQAYGQERGLAKASQEDSASWKTKARAKAEALRDAVQHQKLLQEAATSAEALAQDAQQHQQDTSEENSALKQEIQAIAEDLEALVKENQMIGHQLVAITAERDRWQADMGAIAERAKRAETLARCRDSEASQLCREHEVLLTEHRLMERNHAALQHDLASCQGELAARCDDLEVLKDAHTAAEAQVTQQSQDIQAWEQQVASLSRQVAKVTSEQEDAQRERQTLLDSLRASEQAKFHLEQQCQQLQQRAAGLSGKVHSLTGHCEDAEADAQALQHRLGLEAERVADLETLLGRLRASQFHLQGSTQRGLGAHSATLAGFELEGDAKAHARASRKAASLEAALASAEAKAAALQSSVRELQAENTSLGASLSAVRAERNALNAAVRARTSRSGPIGPSDCTESSTALARARADAAQLKEENTRLLDLLSTVDAERSALDRENWALRGIGVCADAPDQDAGEAPGDEAAQLALELARERSQREKAESDFEELLENLERQARHPDLPLWKGADASTLPEMSGDSSASDMMPHRTHSRSTALPESHATSLSSGEGSGTDARVLRLMFAMKPWQKPMTYIEGESLAEAQRKDEIFKSFFARTQALLAKPIPFSGQPAETWLDKEKDLSADLASARSNVNDALLDSIDLSSALDALFNLVRNVNRYMNEREASAVKDKGVQPCASLLSEVTEYVAQILSEFGIKGYTSGVTEGDPGSRKAALEAFAGFRRTVYDLAKSAKANPSEPKDALVKNLMQAADRVRDKDMPELGIRLEDSADGSPNINEMSADEQLKYRDREAAAKPKKEMQQKEARDSEQKRQSKDRDKLARLEKDYASLQAAEDPKKKVKQIKDVWAALKPLKITPEDHTLGPEERQLVEDILSGSRHVHEKQLQGFQALWAVLNRADASDAEKLKAEKELLQKIKEALPEATEPWLVQIVPEVLR